MPFRISHIGMYLTKKGYVVFNCSDVEWEGDLSFWFSNFVISNFVPDMS